MSKDLISRKALLNAFDAVIAQYNWEDDGVIMDILTCVRDMVYDQPTAYDIDKVVEQLEETFDKWGLDEGKKEIMREIVKGGEE